jgi:GNAT superfamily N-acetyltransferase
MFRRATVEDLSSRALRDLVGLSVYRRDAQRVERLLEKVRSGGSEMYLALDGDAMVGQMAVTRTLPAVIQSISVDPGHRRTGVGRILIQGYLGIFEDASLEAETDADAVGFYHRQGFKVKSLAERYPGVIRYNCTYDHSLWDPLSCREAFQRLHARGIRAWVAGGWALDLFLGRQTRPHVDTDIVIRRSDQDGIAEVVFLAGEGDRWAYRRDRRIGGSLNDFGLVDGDGTAYLRPEIQLLYKGGSSRRRPKDTDDFSAVLPYLSDSAKEWLARSLEVQFPLGHEWIAHLEGGSRE